MRAHLTGGRVAVVGLAAGSLLVPLLLNDAWLTVLVLMELAVLVTVGISLLMGYAGQVSLGQGAFYATGAYTAGLLATQGLPPLLGLAAAPLSAAALATLVGVPLLRLHGHFLAFATLALQMILLSLVGQTDALGGDLGLIGIPQLQLGGLVLAGGRGYAYLAWVAVAVVLTLTHNLIHSRPGRGLRALATSESAAAASGVPTGRYKLAVFAISAGYAGLAGGIYAFFLGYIAPGSFPVLLSIEFVVMAVVGGLGTVWGAVVGAVAVTLLVQALTQLSTLPGMPPAAPSMLSYAAYALVLVGVLLLVPGGLVPAARARLARRTHHRQAPGAHPEAPPLETARPRAGSG